MIKVGVVGAGGYTGLELIKMLISHPHFRLEYIATRSGGGDIEELHPSLLDLISIPVESSDVDEMAKRCELIFLALPHKESMGIAKELLNRGIKVVDLSADYRLERETYEQAYCPHEDPTHLDSAVYGLIEYYRDDIAKAQITAGPGCYPTATLLGILPFIPYLKEDTPLFIDAKSGVSGAGKKLSETTHFVTINDNFFAYNPLKHRHAPEIAEKIRKIKGREFQINFVPHLIPATRGELVSIYAVLKDDIDPMEVLSDAYGDEEFIRIRNKPVDVKSVAGTHFCDIFAAKNGNSLFVSSAIDNLFRGAASQAMAAANIMMGIPENTSLPTIPYMP